MNTKLKKLKPDSSESNSRKIPYVTLAEMKIHLNIFMLCNLYNI